MYILVKTSFYSYKILQMILYFLPNTDVCDADALMLSFENTNGNQQLRIPL